MACIKEIKRSAAVAFAPDSEYLAAGTRAELLHPSFSTSSVLEILNLDLESDNRDVRVAGEAKSGDRFTRLAWSKPCGSVDYHMGLVAGALHSGDINIWNPLDLIRSEPGDVLKVVGLKRHELPVHGLEFSARSPSVLASGADDGEIRIWNLDVPKVPQHSQKHKGKGLAAQDAITSLSWHSKHGNILASSSHNGTMVIWDLKENTSVLSFSDSVRRRVSALQWNPDGNNELIVASDEDSSSSLKLYDLRNPFSPLKEITGNTKGVIAMSWCPYDSSFLLTSAKNYRTICWNIKTAEIVCELPADTMNLDVQWYPKVTGVISASSCDEIGIYDIEECKHGI